MSDSQTTFTNAFDHTFTGYLVEGQSPARVEGCPTTYRLGWLTPVGWCYWDFEAPDTETANYETLGSYVSDRTRRDTRRQATQVLILRTARLDHLTRQVLSTVYNSVAVFLLVTDSTTGVIEATPVRVPPGEQTLNQSRRPIDNMTVSVELPVRQSFRNA